MLRRLHLVVFSHPSATPVNQDLFEEVRRHGMDVTIVAPLRWPTGYGVQLLSRSPSFAGRLIGVEALLAGNIPLHVYRARLGRMLRRLRPDAVYVHHEPYGLATAQVFAAASRLPHRPVLGFYSAQNLVKRYPLPVRAVERFVHAEASFAFPITPVVESVLRTKGYGGRTVVLPLGVRVPSVLPSLPGGRSFTIGYVGRLTSEKGVDTLLDAVASTAVRPLACRIVGDGPEREVLQRRASALGLDGVVTWAGYIDHAAMDAAYGSLDVLVVPSRTTRGWTEQFGRVVIEALANGVPVIAADSGELPALMASTGGGWTFPEGDAEALRAILVDVAADPVEREARARRGRAAVARLYGLESLGARLAAEIAAVVTGPGR